MKTQESGHTALPFLILALGGGLMPLPLYPQGNSTQYSFDRKLGGPQSRSGCCAEEKNPFPLLGIEPSSVVQPVA
jgi:hypothetical protein